MTTATATETAAWLCGKSEAIEVEVANGSVFGADDFFNLFSEARTSLAGFDGRYHEVRHALVIDPKRLKDFRSTDSSFFSDAQRAMASMQHTVSEVNDVCESLTCSPVGVFAGFLIATSSAVPQHIEIKKKVVLDHHQKPWPNAYHSQY